METIRKLVNRSNRYPVNQFLNARSYCVNVSSNLRYDTDFSQTLIKLLYITTNGKNVS